MPTTRGLELLETLDLHGPLTVTEIAHITGHDKSWVSRIVTACEPDGWIVREHGRVALGPRAALLAYGSAAGEMIRRAQPLVDAVAGVTGLTAQAYGLAGRYATALAAAGSGGHPSSLGLGMSASLVATAAGQAILAQLDPTRAGRLLPPEPFPDPLEELLSNPGYVAFAAGRFGSVPVLAGKPLSVPRDRAELQERLDVVREQGFALDLGDLHPSIGCLAVPWPDGGDCAALTCLGTPTEIRASAGLARAVLEGAAAPAATRDDVVAAAAAAATARHGTARHYSVAP